MSRAEGPTLADLANRLHSLSIHLLRRVRGTDVESGLSAARLSVLSVLVFGGERSLGALAEAEQVTPATMSRLVTALEAEGMVRRRADPSDGRRVVIAATTAGETALGAARSRRVEGMVELLEDLSREERGVVARAVEALESVLSSRRER